MNTRTQILDSEHALLILKELEASPNVTQRHLAVKLSVSLGKVNFLISQLLDKGIIEAKNFKNSKHKASYMYLLTAHGIKTKLELTHRFFVWKLQQYEQLKKEIEAYKKDMRGTKSTNTGSAARGGNK